MGATLGIETTKAAFERHLGTAYKATTVSLRLVSELKINSNAELKRINMPDAKTWFLG